MTTVFEITPVPKPRMTQRDKRPPVRPPVARYWAFADEIRVKANQAGFRLPAAFDVVFHLPMPESWSERKKVQMDGRPHQSRPDRDNLEKALADALCPDKDSHIYDGRVAKYWARVGRIEITPHV
jgi:Holliday junction resolvase RusA-like endonuclease